MQLNRFTDYSLRVLIFLAVNRDRLCTIQEIADRFQLSKNHLMKIANELVRGGYVESARGRGGGLRLAGEPGDIPVGAVVRHCEGHIPFVECLGCDVSTCIISRKCTLKQVFARSLEALYQVLDEYTVADLADTEGEFLARLLRSAQG